MTRIRMTSTTAPTTAPMMITILYLSLSDGLTVETTAMIENKNISF